MDILILAGGRVPTDLAEFAGVELRAELPFRGRRMMDWVVDAVSHLGQPWIVGHPDPDSPRSIPGGSSFIDSIEKGLEHCQGPEILIVTGDLPYLTRAAVDDFLNQCDRRMMLNYPIIRAEAAERQFPGMKRTLKKLREGNFTGGNIALVDRQLLMSALPKLQSAYQHRKSVLKLGQLVGPRTLLRLVVSFAWPQTLSVDTLAQSVGKMIGGPVKAILTDFAEIGADIDNLDQYRSAISASNP